MINASSSLSVFLEPNNERESVSEEDQQSLLSSRTIQSKLREYMSMIESTLSTNPIDASINGMKLKATMIALDHVLSYLLEKVQYLPGTMTTVVLPIIRRSKRILDHSNNKESSSKQTTTTMCQREESKLLQGCKAVLALLSKPRDAMGIELSHNVRRRIKALPVIMIREEEEEEEEETTNSLYTQYEIALSYVLCHTIWYRWLEIDIPIIWNGENRFPLFSRFTSVYCKFRLCLDYHHSLTRTR
jgi:hypothetical protein